jgi:hypothetical protein
MPDYHGKRGGKKKTGGMKMGRSMKKHGKKMPPPKRKKGKMSREEFIERGEDALGDMPL